MTKSLALITSSWAGDIVTTFTELHESKKSFTAGCAAICGLCLGLIVGMPNNNAFVGAILGAAIFAGLAFGVISLCSTARIGRLSLLAVFLIAGGVTQGALGGILAIIIAWPFGWFIFWIHHSKYRAHLLPYLTSSQVLWHYAFRVICGSIFFFLIAPIIVIMPLSFNAQDFFTFTPEMLSLDPEGYSLKHYQDFFTNQEWQRSFQNSIIIAPIATILSVSLGTLAAIGLSQSHVPFKRIIMAILISPMIVPLIISATGMFFFYATVGNFLENSLGLDKNFVGYVKVVLAHTALGIPFVIITVTATLVGFDISLTRAAANMGANPITTFFRVQMPLIMPGVISGGLFAFITSFDEVVVIMFVGSASQKTLPWQMFTGLREQISPTILAVATILVGISIALLFTLELLRRRSERLRGVSPG
jgi:putative spermidine/putrescine transport system permease protein